MKKIIVPHVEPLVGNEELKEIKDCFKRKWITGGPKLKIFQEKIAKICKVKYAIGVCNGTQALYVALKALGVGSGDEVIVPDFTFIACSNAVIWTGAKPVFVDVDKRTFNIDPKEIKKAITKKTKAIMPVHIYGQPAEMDEIIKIAKKHNLYVIEDAAEALGAKYKGKPVGSFGHVACLSFYADKVITTGEGGMVLTNDPQIAKRVTILLNQGRMGRGWYIHEKIGFNFRMSDIQAAIGLAQLKKFKKIVKKRKKMERLYKRYLRSVKEVKFPYISPKVFNIPFRFTILVEDPQSLMEFLKKEGIKTARSFYPLHLQPCYKNLKIKGKFPNSLFAYQRILRLPSGNTLTEKKVKFVCEKIKSFFKKQ